MLVTASGKIMMAVHIRDRDPLSTGSKLVI